MNKFRSRLLFTFVSLIVFILVGLGLLLETVFENYYIDHAKENGKRDRVCCGISRRTRF